VRLSKIPQLRVKSAIFREIVRWMPLFLADDGYFSLSDVPETPSLIHWVRGVLWVVVGILSEGGAADQNGCLMTGPKHRIILVDRQLIVRAALASWLRQQAGIEVVAEFSDAKFALDRCASESPDVVAMDPMTPGLDPLAAAREIAARWPVIRIVFLSSRTSERLACDCMAAGGHCFLSKDAEPSAFLDAVRGLSRSVRDRGCDVEPGNLDDGIVADDASKTMSVPAGAIAASLASAIHPPHRLTSRELEVLRYVARGLSQRDMSKLMYLSPKTVERHVSRVMKKVEIHDRVGLARYAIREGIDPL